MLLLSLHKQYTWKFKKLRLCEYIILLIKILKVYQGMAEKLHIHKDTFCGTKIKNITENVLAYCHAKIIQRNYKMWFQVRAKK